MYGTSPDTLIPPLSGAGDHGTLGGLGDDDHSQYALADGTRGDFAATVHTHTASDLTDFAEAVDDRVDGLLVAGTNVTLTYDDGLGTLTIDASSAGSHTHETSDIIGLTEAVDDRVAALIVAGTGISKAYDDANGTLTIAVSGTPAHTHAAADVIDFFEAVDDRVGDLLVAGTNVTLTYDDVSGSLTIDANSAGTHTHPTTDITGFDEAVDDRVAALIVAGDGFDETYDDGLGTLTFDVDPAFILSTIAENTVQHKATWAGLVSLSDASTITVDWSLSNQFGVTLGGNRTIEFSNLQHGQLIRIRLQQDGTGSRLVTWPSGIRWAGGSAPTLTTDPDKADWIGLLCTDSVTPVFDGGPGWANL